MITTTHEKMHAEHRMWESEILLWREDLRAWQHELAKAQGEIKSLEEALAAATVNAAYSLDVHGEVGSVEVGKRADLVVLRSARILDLLRVGVPAIATVIKDGRVVVRDGRRAA